METQAYVIHVAYTDGKGFCTLVASNDSSEYCKNHVLAGVFTLTVPDPDPTMLRLAAVQGLRAEQGELQAKMTELEGRIQMLQCIEYKEEQSDLAGGLV